MKRWLPALVIALCFSACGGDSPTPNAPSPPTPPPPTPPPAPTLQSLRITAPGTIQAGNTSQLSATAVLSNGTTQAVAASSVQWASSNTTVATISASGVLTALQAGAVDVRGTYQSVTSEASTVSVTPPPPLWTMSGTGANVFTLPSTISRVRITGNFGGSCQNFIVWIANRLIVNEILGTCSIAIGRDYSGVHATPGGGLAEVRNSTGVNWTFTEVR